MSTLALVFFLVVLNFDYILEFMGRYSPIIETRLRLTVEEGEMTGRDILYKQAFDLFLDSPILGSQFAFFAERGTYYSHNIILDALMGLGIIGGWMLVYMLVRSLKVSYQLIKKGDTSFWICLILMQQIFSSMTSGAFYQNQLLSVLLAYMFIWESRVKPKALFYEK